MKNIKIIITGILLWSIGTVCLPGCYKLQSDYNRTPDTLDAHIYKTAWQYIKDRSYFGSNTANDTIFRRMYDAIIYSGIDTNEYTKTNRTFILMNNTAGKTVWSSVKTASNVAGTGWASYPKDTIKCYLLYLILDGIYNHYTLPAVTDLTVNTLAPAGVFTATPYSFKIPNATANPL